MNDHSFERRELSFEQAEGAEPLPHQMALKIVSPVLAARLFGELHSAISSSVSDWNNCVHGVWASILRRHFIEKLGGFADDFSLKLHILTDRYRKIYSSGDYIKILGTTEWLARNSAETNFPRLVERILVAERAAYRLVDRRDIVPLVSQHEGDALLGALVALDHHNIQGSRSHLKAAARAASAGEYADSVRESIHAIESAARSISPSTKFSDALAQIEAAHGLHAALKKGLLALYGYTSDEQGIRHPLLNTEDANVREEDALLMLGICSAAVTYLLSKKIA